MPPTSAQILGAALLLGAIVHTFSTGIFERMARRHARHAGVWRLLAEVEVVFGFWAMLLFLGMSLIEGPAGATRYLDGCDFTEPMFVFAIMVIAGTRPILQFAACAIAGVARVLPVQRNLATYLLVLTIVPLLGSLITEPAAMTLAAILLRDEIFGRNASEHFKYATLGALFVNISIGGTLTTFAAPPIFMVAEKWHWDMNFMLSTFGSKAALAIVANAGIAALRFREELFRMRASQARVGRVPLPIVGVHLLFLGALVAHSHHPATFMGVFLFFLGFAHAYGRYQSRLVLKEALLVAFFLAGLVVLGGMQAWWLKPMLLNLDADAVYYGAAALTAFTDNAVLTYLASLVDSLTPAFKVALVAGAVTGGGLTIITNAPNPAGAAILKPVLKAPRLIRGSYFLEQSSPLA